MVLSKEDGSVLMWGYNTNGQLGLEGTLSGSWRINELLLIQRLQVDFGYKP